MTDSFAAATERSAKASPSTSAVSKGEGRAGAVGMLTVYLVLLCLIPSNLRISALGSLGRPSFLWGLVLLFWWIIYQLESHSANEPRTRQPVRVVFALLIVSSLTSFALAMLRGQPADQVSPAFTGTLEIVSWGGVLLVALDGIRDMSSLRTLARRLVGFAIFEAALGAVQFLTKQGWVDRLSIPGMASNGSTGAQVRGDLLRAAGTATNPLEYAALLCMCLPIAIALAVAPGTGRERHGTLAVLLAWAPAVFLTLSLLVATSRSALLGMATAVVLMLPVLSARLRILLAGAVVIAAGVVMVAVPSMLATMQGLFTGVSDDPSALSRTNGLAAAPGFIAASPVLGTGYGTFSSRYYIFDDEWLLLTVELGIVGVVCFGLLLVTGIWSAQRARQVGSTEARALAQAFTAAIATGAVTFAGFDGLSFPMSGAVLFLLVGLCGALTTATRMAAATVSRTFVEASG
ncbi:O-antigen ligase family protein [Gryllotalpicola protaetiae]|uniref:O-antigen ligase domain-containing protein n=1 Tax=Gryllotalpicola protaetiae TaxID=2419771 RepID=A0A387BMC2_9MICO|nr:O-antigen ligase family protein [Gryllotalpicola protaetiae]AYG03184.1 O-antigen ligase domain-containing protein [Gryllotalpicola protaetiae]